MFQQHSGNCKFLDYKELNPKNIKVSNKKKHFNEKYLKKPYDIYKKIYIQINPTLKLSVKVSPNDTCESLLKKVNVNR